MLSREVMTSLLNLISDPKSAKSMERNSSSKFDKSQSIIFYNGEIELKVSIDNETVWLNGQQLFELFVRDIKLLASI